MATVPARVPWSADDLPAAAKQLPSAEPRQFQREFAAWFSRNEQPSQPLPLTGDEEGLLAVIHENSALPAAEQRHVNRLRRKQQGGTLTGAEEKQLRALWSRVEEMDVARLAALVELARRHGTDVRTLMRQLGLPENRDAF
jgi:hypothetical protein